MVFCVPYTFKFINFTKPMQSFIYIKYTIFAILTSQRECPQQLQLRREGEKVHYFTHYFQLLHKQLLLKLYIWIKHRISGYYHFFKIANSMRVACVCWRECVCVCVLGGGAGGGGKKILAAKSIYICLLIYHKRRIYRKSHIIKKVPILPRYNFCDTVWSDWLQALLPNQTRLFWSLLRR